MLAHLASLAHLAVLAHITPSTLDMLAALVHLVTQNPSIHYCFVLLAGLVTLACINISLTCGRSAQKGGGEG